MAANIPPTEQDFELLSAYLDNQLSAQDRTRIEARLTAEPTLRTALDELRLTVAVLKAAPQIALPRNFTLDVARYRRPTPWWARYQTMQLIGTLGTVASVILIVIGVGLFSAIQQSTTAPAAAKLTGSTANNIALAPTETATPPPTQAAMDKVVLPTTTQFVPTLVPTQVVAENAAESPTISPTFTARFSAQSAPSGGAVAPAPQAAQSGAASGVQPPHVPETTTPDLAQAQATFREAITATPLAKVQLFNESAATSEANDEASDSAALKAATAQPSATTTASATPALTDTAVAVVPTIAPAPPAVSPSPITSQPTAAVPIVLIMGIALLIFSIMLFGIGWLRSRLRG